MDIQFIYKKGDEYKFASSYTDLYRTVAEADIDFCEYIKLLELNSSFKQIIKEYRARFGLPEEGYRSEELFKIMDSFNKKEMLYIGNSHLVKDYKINKQVVRYIPLIAIANLCPVLFKRSISWEPELLYSNYDDNTQSELLGEKFGFSYEMMRPWGAFDLVPTFDNLEQYVRLSTEFPYTDSRNDLVVKVQISNKVSKLRVHNFIDKNWDEIQEILNKIERNNHQSEWSKVKLNVRDLEIVKLRDTGLKFREVADKVSGKSMDEDSVKAIYHRTKKYIESLIQKGNKKPK